MDFFGIDVIILFFVFIGVIIAVVIIRNLLLKFNVVEDPDKYDSVVSPEENIKMKSSLPSAINPKDVILEIKTDYDSFFQSSNPAPLYITPIVNSASGKTVFVPTRILRVYSGLLQIMDFKGKIKNLETNNIAKVYVNGPTSFNVRDKIYAIFIAFKGNDSDSEELLILPPKKANQLKEALGSLKVNMEINENKF